MNKRGNFSFLKSLLCLLFFTITGVVFGAKTVQEPNSIKDIADKDFYLEYDKERDLCFGMERVTKENVDWWLKKIGYDILFHFELQRRHKLALTEYEVMKAKNTLSQPLPSGLDAYITDLCNEALIPTQSERDAHLMYTPILKEAEKNKQFMAFLDENTSFTESDIPEICKSICHFSPALAEAARGFHQNLVKYKDDEERNLWVAYVSSKRVDGLLCSAMDVTTPCIKIATTVKIGKYMYSPLGLYKSPIAHAIDEQRGNPTTRNLSLPFYSFIARTVIEKIMSSVGYMVFRPITSLMNIIKSSRIRYSASESGLPQKNVPHICFKKAKDSDLAYCNFSLVNPCKNTIYKFDNNHWFARSPFLGGVKNKNAFKGCPFIIIDCAELVEYGTKAQMHDKIGTFSGIEDREGEVKSCAFCKKELDKKARKKCSICMKTYYCSRECQKDDWKEHKKICTPSGVVLKKCAKCEKIEERPHQFKKCGRCMKVHYCSEVCQKENWPDHKITCKSPTPLEELKK